MAKLRRSDQYITESVEVLRMWASLSRLNLFGWRPVAAMIRVAEAEALKLESQLTETGTRIR